MVRQNLWDPLAAGLWYAYHSTFCICHTNTKSVHFAPSFLIHLRMGLVSSLQVKDVSWDSELARFSHLEWALMTENLEELCLCTDTSGWYDQADHSDNKQTIGFFSPPCRHSIVRGSAANPTALAGASTPSSHRPAKVVVSLISDGGNFGERIPVDINTQLMIERVHHPMKFLH